MFRPQSLAAAVLALLSGSAAHAAGNHTQGTFICGQGLDILVPQYSGGNAPLVPKGNCLEVVSGTMPNGPLVLNDSRRTTITLNTPCTQVGSYWNCPSATFPTPGFCDATAASPNVRLYVLKATVSDGGFTFGGTSLTVVCRGNEGAPVQISCGAAPPEPYSTSGDCIDWGYPPTATNQKTFKACVRMARADYKGNGASATRVGTWIQPYGGSQNDDPACTTDCGSCLEALWNDNGPACVYHRRWSDISNRLLQITGVSPSEARELLGKFKFHVKHGSDELFCVSDMRDSDGAFKALLRNRSEIYECTVSGQLIVTPCGNPQGGFDPDCIKACPPP
jgi:hypothetical protein